MYSNDLINLNDPMNGDNKQGVSRLAIHEVVSTRNLRKYLQRNNSSK